MPPYESPRHRDGKDFDTKKIKNQAKIKKSEKIILIMNSDIKSFVELENKIS